MVVDRLEVDLPREDEVGVLEGGAYGKGLLECDTDGVFDEARPQVSVLDERAGTVGELRAELETGAATGVQTELAEWLQQS